MVTMQSADNITIEQQDGKNLIPAQFIGAGENGFVLKVSDASNDFSALKVVPVIAGLSNGKEGQVNREMLFYKYLAETRNLPNLASATNWWSVQDVETSKYLKWHKTLRRKLSIRSCDYPSQRIKELEGEFKLIIYFIRMKYYEAGNLTTWLQSNHDLIVETYSLRTRIFGDILSAVDFLHQRGLMHRDICPNNILLTKQERLNAVLGDVDSIVSCGEQARCSLTKVRENYTGLRGTNPYVAPEIDEDYYDERCDLYSLGVVALNMFFNVLDYSKLCQALYKIRVQNVFPICAVPDEIIWLNILKAQLAERPELRMKSCSLLTLVTKTTKQSLYLQDFASNALISMKDIGSCWVVASPMPEPKRQWFRVAACAGNIYVIGGRQQAGNTWQESNLVQKYDTQKGWREWPSMLEQRSSCGAAVLGGRLFAVGGCSEKCSFLSSAEECDLVTGRWTHVAPMTTARRGVGVAALGNLLFAVGGRDSSKFLNSAECYDPRAGSWTSLALMNGSYAYLGCTTLGNRLYVAGGLTPGLKWSASVEWFDLRFDRWTRARDMDVQREDFALAAVNGQLLAAGGWNSGGPLDTVEVYDEKRDTWSTLDVRLPCGWEKCVGCVVEE